MSRVDDDVFRVCDLCVCGRWCSLYCFLVWCYVCCGMVW